MEFGRALTASDDERCELLGIDRWEDVAVTRQIRRGVDRTDDPRVGTITDTLAIPFEFYLRCYKAMPLTQDERSALSEALRPILDENEVDKIDDNCIF